MIYQFSIFYSLLDSVMVAVHRNRLDCCDYNISHSHYYVNTYLQIFLYKMKKKKAAPSIPEADDLACKYCVFCFPLADGDAHPKAVDAQRDNAQYPPLYPQ